MENILKDAKFALHLLAKHKGFTFAALIALALGIGANSAIFSVVYAVLLKPLPYKDPARLLMLWQTNPQIRTGFDKFPSPAGKFLDWRSQSSHFENLVAFEAISFNLEGTGEAEKLAGSLVSADLFTTLGVAPLYGRGFLADEERPGHSDVVIIGHGLWQRRFASDLSILGNHITLNGRSYTVVGIMPPGFGFPRGAEMPPYLRLSPQTEIWSPLAFDAAQIANRAANMNLAVLGRTKPDVTIEQVRTEMNAIALRLEQQYPETDAGFRISVVSMPEQAVGELEKPLMVLVGAVLFVLLIACANVANLLMARASTRTSEIAIRQALGASRGRIFRQLMTESIILSLLGGIIGLLSALLLVEVLVAVTPENIPRIKEVGLDATVIIFTLLISFITGVIFGLIPALQLSRADLTESLKQEVRTYSSGGHTVLKLLVVSEMALAVVLLIGAGLMIKSFTRLQQVDPGLNPHNVLTMQVSIPTNRYDDDQMILSFGERVLQRIESISGVESASITSELPMTGAESIEGFVFEGRPMPKSIEELSTTSYHVVSYKYFDTIGISLRKGRKFAESDNKDAPKVVIINQTFADRFYQNEDPIGKRISFNPFDPEAWLTIVGVVQDVKHTALDQASTPAVFRPFAQRPGSEMALAVRSSSTVAGLSNLVRSAIWQVDRDIPIFNVRSMEEIIADSIAERRFNTLLLELFAALALILAAVGIYGVISYGVTQRTHEIGIRFALGATPVDLVKMILKQAMSLAFAGVALGLVAAFGLTRLLSSMLFTVAPRDFITFASVAFALLLVALAASYIPARRIFKLDPIQALRQSG